MLKDRDTYDWCLDIIDPVTGKVLFHDLECEVEVEDFNRVENTIDIHHVWLNGLRLLDGGEMAQMLRRIIISAAKDDEWLKDQVFSRNEDDDPNGVWAKADADYNERTGK